MTLAPSCEWLDSVATAMDESGGLREFLNATTLPEGVHEQLHTAVLAALYQDRPRAILLTRALQELAGIQGDGLSKAWAARAQGHVEHVQGDYKSAVKQYLQAAALFDGEGLELEVGRTLLSCLQALIYQGAYDEALACANRAETIFYRLGDVLRLARLDSNVGNILFRRDCPTEAMERYTRALEGFEVAGEPRDSAAALSNLAVASINLGRFNQALDFYQKARALCEANGLKNLVARADYNIAYLYYLRGDYGDARKLYRVARERAAETNDRYHAALCDLDEAEMHLELNLTAEAEPMARRAIEAFEAMGMLYEQAKAQVNLAVAYSQRNHYQLAERALRQARRLFVREKNPLWPALVDQLRAVIAFHEMRFSDSQRLGTAAWRVLTKTKVPGRAAHCQILLARLWVRAGQADRARTASREALELAGSDASPSLLFHAQLVRGEIDEMQGRWDQARDAYETARQQVEDLRGRVDTEDLRISLLKDKLAVYESLVTLCLDSPVSSATDSVRYALSLVQQAKSRNLADRLGAPLALEEGTMKDSAGFEELRRDLNWIYRQIDVAAVRDRPSAAEPGQALQQKARELETQLQNAKARQQRIATIGASAVYPDDTAPIQRSLRSGELLLEYYEARGTLHVFLLSHHSLQSVRLGPFKPVRQLLKLVQFQLEKFGCRQAGYRESAAITHHFHELYRLLIAPFEDRLAPFSHLIAAPHRTLHGLPFAALHDGKQLLIERFTLSASPSAQVLARCRERDRQPGQGSLVMAVPDPLLPRIEEEARAVAEALPGANLLLGEEASYQAFCELAPSARILHLATHGIFRKDNPMFSALQLADSRLSRLDLNRMVLNLDLLTLSACNSGSAVAVAGDELLGLVRGFLLAGVRSLLVTLWEIDDSSTLDFMRSFYRQVSSGETLSGSVRKATLEVRRKYPHPYYWAPFLLVGDPDAIR